MGIAERKKRERQQRIDLILDAAEKVFAEKGFRHATMDEIAEQAELSKGTLYLYFKTKEVVFVGIEIRGLTALAKSFERAARSKRIGMRKIEAIGDAYFQFSQDYPYYFSAMSNFEKLDPAQATSTKDEPMVQECQERGMKVHKVLTDAISVGIEDGSIRKDINPMKAAILLWAQSNGVIQLHMHRAAQISQSEGFEPDFLMVQHSKSILAFLAAVK